MRTGALRPNISKAVSTDLDGAEDPDTSKDWAAAAADEIGGVPGGMPGLRPSAEAVGSPSRAGGVVPNIGLDSEGIVLPSGLFLGSPLAAQLSILPPPKERAVGELPNVVIAGGVHPNGVIGDGTLPNEVIAGGVLPNGVKAGGIFPNVVIAGEALPNGVIRVGPFSATLFGP